MVRQDKGWIEIEQHPQPYDERWFWVETQLNKDLLLRKPLRGRPIVISCRSFFPRLQRIFSRWISVTAACLALPAAVDAFDPPKAYTVTAELHGIPDDLLLYAIAQQESGRFFDRANRLIPWPWTLNVEGKAHYFKSQAEAKESLTRSVRLQPKHIGIGLMQITWPYNQHLPWNPLMALDPQINLSLGALILRECFDRHGDWWAAVGCYHSPTKKEAENYSKKVNRRWNALNGVADRSGSLSPPPRADRSPQ